MTEDNCSEQRCFYAGNTKIIFQGVKLESKSTLILLYFSFLIFPSENIPKNLGTSETSSQAKMVTETKWENFALIIKNKSNSFRKLTHYKMRILYSKWKHILRQICLSSAFSRELGFFVVFATENNFSLQKIERRRKRDRKWKLRKNKNFLSQPHYGTQHRLAIVCKFYLSYDS